MKLEVISGPAGWGFGHIESEWPPTLYGLPPRAIPLRALHRARSVRSLLLVSLHLPPLHCHGTRRGNRAAGSAEDSGGPGCVPRFFFFLYARFLLCAGAGVPHLWEFTGCSANRVGSGRSDSFGIELSTGAPGLLPQHGVVAGRSRRLHDPALSLP